jgi:O-antigen/teichoic acid export membrane protein
MHTLLVNWIQQSPFVRFGKEEWIKSGTIGKSWMARLPFVGAGLLLVGALFFLAPAKWLTPIFHLSLKEGLLSLAFLFSLIVSTEIQVILQIMGRMLRLAFIPVTITAITVVFYGTLWLIRKSDALPIAVLGVALLTSGIWIVATFDLLRKVELQTFGLDFGLGRQMVAFAWPILPTLALGYLSTWGNQIVIKQFFSTGDVGLYQGAFQIHALILSATAPFTTILLPKLIERHLKDPTTLRRYLASVAPTLSFLWVIAIIPLISILPRLYILVFGGKFSESLPALNIFLCCAPLAAVGHIYTVLFTIEKRLKDILYLSASMACVNFLTLAIFLPNHGIYGAALSMATSFVINRYLMCLIQHRLLGEPMTKINALFGLSLLFSIGQVALPSVILRFLWAVVFLIFFLFCVRVGRFIDPAVLKQLFKGPFESVGRVVTKIFAPS